MLNWISVRLKGIKQWSWKHREASEVTGTKEMKWVSAHVQHRKTSRGNYNSVNIHWLITNLSTKLETVIAKQCLLNIRTYYWNLRRAHVKQKTHIGDCAPYDQIFPIYEGNAMNQLLSFHCPSKRKHIYSKII